MSDWLPPFFSNPIVSFIGSIASIIGIPLAIYFYLKSIKKRRLTYRVNPVRTQIVNSGTASKLSVTHNGQVMTGDIMAVHVAIWNQGRKSIEPTYILRPLIIETEKNVPILEASILKTNHDVIGLKLDESKCDQGKLEVSWTILEHRDGGIVQMIYEGSPELQITANAVLKGQRAIIDRSEIPGSKEFAHYPVKTYRLFMLLIILAFFIMPFYLFHLWNDPKVGDFLKILTSLLLISLLGLTFWMGSQVRQAKPPFEF